MSFEAMAWAIKQQVGNTTAKFTLLMVANYADEQGRAWPSQETLASGMDASRHTVMRALDFLEEQGFMTRERRHRADGSRAADVLRLDLSRNLLRCKSGEPMSQIATAEPITEPISKPKKVERTRGSRLSDEWNPPPASLVKARAYLDDVTIFEELVKFRNYWLSKAGRDAVKLDWTRTFDNWIINAKNGRPSHGKAADTASGTQRAEPSGNLARIFSKINAAIDAAEDGSEGGGGYPSSLSAG
jgi:DNA-binding MarR family transcriptional regulator